MQMFDADQPSTGSNYNGRFSPGPAQASLIRDDANDGL